MDVWITNLRAWAQEPQKISEHDSTRNCMDVENFLRHLLQLIHDNFSPNSTTDVGFAHILHNIERWQCRHWRTVCVLVGFSIIRQSNLIDCQYRWHRNITVVVMSMGVVECCCRRIMNSSSTCFRCKTASYPIRVCIRKSDFYRSSQRVSPSHTLYSLLARCIRHSIPLFRRTFSCVWIVLVFYAVSDWGNSAKTLVTVWL